MIQIVVTDAILATITHMSLVTSGVYDQVRLNPACSATGTSQSLDILDVASIDIILSKQRTIKALIRLRRCAG